VTQITGETTVQASVPAQEVTVTAPVKARPVQFQQSQTTDPSIPARTTFQEDLTTAGQRRINLIWEYTQAFVAAIVVTTNMGVAVVIALKEVPPVLLANGLIVPGVRPEFPTILSSSLFLIVGFYFSRTNHAAIGGVGAKPTNLEYQGR
jgi:hypothetical protein